MHRARWTTAALVLCQAAGGAPAAGQAPPDTIYSMDPTVVVGSRVRDTRRDLPVSVSVVEGEDLTQASTVGEAVSGLVPGTFVTQRGLMTFGTGPGSAGSLTIRGVGNSTTNSGILVLVDGRADFMGIFGHPLMDAYRTEDVERVEVVRGPASALYGTNAMGGVLNIVTRSGPVPPSLHARYGSHDSRELSGTLGRRLGSTDLHVTATRRQTDGHRANDAYEATNLSARVRRPLDAAWTASAGGYLADYLSREPGPVFAPTPDNYADIVRAGGDVTLEGRGRLGEATVKAHTTLGDHELGNGFRSTDQVLGLVLFGTTRLAADTRLSLGLDTKRYGGDARNVTLGQDYGDHRVTEWAPHVHLHQTLTPRLLLDGSLRLEHHSLFGATWVPHVGAVLQPTADATLRATLARGFHSPTVKDLYMPFPTANPDLEPEQVWNLETGGELHLAGADLDLAVYRQQVSSLIRTVVGPGGPALRNSGEWTTHGLELEARRPLARRALATLSYAWYGAPKKGYGTPGQALTLGLHAVPLDNSPAASRRVTGGLTVRHTRDLYGMAGQPAALVALEDCTVVDARLAAQVRPGVRLRLQVDNLLDTDYATLPGYPMPGITASLGLDLEWNR